MFGVKLAGLIPLLYTWDQISIFQDGLSFPLWTHTHAARVEMWPKLRIRLRKRERDMTKDRLRKAGHGNPKAFTIFMTVGVNCVHVCAWFIKQASVWDKRCSKRYYCILPPSQKFIPPSLSPPSDAAVSTFPKYSVGSRESGWEACNICSQTTKGKKAERVLK